MVKKPRLHTNTGRIPDPANTTPWNNPGFKTHSTSKENLLKTSGNNGNLPPSHLTTQVKGGQYA